MNHYQFSANITTPLLGWYDTHAADLPWRGQDVYPIWLSEIMLQQTQVTTVIPYYRRFLDKFPTIQALAGASLDAVLKLWEGLGYYSRARNLHKAAQIVVEEYGGDFPKTAAALQALPGIGRYTASAIASIAFGERVGVLDGNVIRVFSRLLDLEDDVTQSATKKALWQLADEIVPAERPGDANQAWMELGRTVCTPRQPLCDQCPIRSFCRAFASGTQAQRPVKKKRQPTPHYDVTAGIIRNDSGQILIAQRPADGLLGGLWEFPGGKQENGESLPDCLQRELREELAIEVEVGALFARVKHAFTHFKITLHAYECRYVGAIAPYKQPQAVEAADWAWIEEAEFEQYSFGKADREIIRALLDR